MNKQETNKLVPELRFPEFRGKKTWVEKKLGDLVDIKSGISPAKYILKSKGKHAFLKVEDLNNCDKYQVESREYSDSAENIVPKMSVIFPKRGASIQLNKVRINVDDVLMDSNLMAITPNDKIEAEFLYYKIVDVQLFKIADTSSIPQINNKHVAPYNITIPAKSEQQKIADCLSSIDDLITAQNQKLDNLKVHKKGLMQQLFPANGEMVPKLRFPEFQDVGEWQMDILDNSCISISSGKEKSDVNGIYNLYGSTGIIGKTLVYGYDGNYILVARVGANAGLLNKVSGKFGATDNTLVIVLQNPDKLDFLYHTLDRIDLNKMVFGSGQPLITGKQLKELGIVLPLPKEQQKIADCLSSIDDLIIAQTEKIDTLKTHKKGLMQQLFPKINNVYE